MDLYDFRDLATKVHIASFVYFRYNVSYSDDTALLQREVKEIEHDLVNFNKMPSTSCGRFFLI
jgi:hypothetical protein